MSFIRFDGMTWPLPQCDDDGLAWRLRYAHLSINKGDMLAASEILMAYQALILKTQAERNKICKRIKAELCK